MSFHRVNRNRGPYNLCVPHSREEAVATHTWDYFSPKVAVELPKSRVKVTHEHLLCVSLALTVFQGSQLSWSLLAFMDLAVSFHGKNITQVITLVLSHINLIAVVIAYTSIVLICFVKGIQMGDIDPFWRHLLSRNNNANNKWHLDSAYCVLCIVPNTIHVLTHLSLTVAQWVRYHYNSHFYRWEHWGSERSRKLLEVKQLVSVKWAIISYHPGEFPCFCCGSCWPRLLRKCYINSYYSLDPVCQQLK